MPQLGQIKALRPCSAPQWEQVRSISGSIVTVLPTVDETTDGESHPAGARAIPALLPPARAHEPRRGVMHGAL